MGPVANKVWTPGDAGFVVDLLWRFRREPMRYSAHAICAARMPGRSDLILRIALGHGTEPTDPELKRAAAFFVWHIFFRRDATHYDVLGLAPAADADAVREHFRLLMQLIHPDRSDRDGAWAADCAVRVNRAYAILKHADTRTRYDRQLIASTNERVAPGRIRRVANRRGAGRRRARYSRLPILPEWVTSGVGGFMWRHPAATIFGGIIAASILIVGLVAWSELDEALIRVAPSTVLLNPLRLT